MRSMISALAFAAAALGGATMAQAQSPVQPSRTAYIVEPLAPTGQITIQGTGVRLRAEPFATRDTPVLSSGSSGLVLNVVGIARLPDWNWYQVVLGNGQKAFIRSDYTSAPSKGGAAPASSFAAAPLPAATRIDNPPASTPLSSTPAYPTYPAPTASTQPPSPAPAPTPLVSAPPPVSAAPVSGAPAFAAPVVPPASDAPISLVPRSPNSGGLSSRDPG